jgi:transposase
MAPRTINPDPVSTEGQIHRLKLLKRRMYGRAGFAVLRNRVLHAA